ncbi:hypothetical protein IAR55_000356 [Kwoniella newhampshirensis]|uniref:WSC domain-containing protein n=1 Tax=Kwoniella newhampshirensis TaxID=1651941 RepID=A0AAW0Z6H7_9TREE
MFSPSSLFFGVTTLFVLVRARPTEVQRDSNLRWVENGCLIDYWERALNGYQFSDTSMTQELCASTCLSKGYTYAGLEYGTQCFCVNGISYGEYSAGAGTAASECNESCAGNSAENCGGDFRLWMFHYTNALAPSAAQSIAPASTPAPASSASTIAASEVSTSPTVTSVAPAPTPTVPSGWSRAATQCIAEGLTGRALVGESSTSSAMTWEMCVSFCGNAGYTIAGLEYSDECYCGNILTNGASTNSGSKCDMSCSGVASAICGGSSALTLFVADSARSTLSSDLTSKVISLPSGWFPASITCVSEGSNGRALDSASISSGAMTVGTCLAYCQSKGFQYAGLEYANECYSLVTCFVPATTHPIAVVPKLYQNPSLAQNLNVVNNFAASGCIQEVSGRALSGASKVNDNMTIEICTSFCSSAGYKYAGVEYGTECYCGHSFANGASILSRSNQCNMACGGSSSDICGGPNAISLWKA